MDGSNEVNAMILKVLQALVDISTKESGMSPWTEQLYSEKSPIYQALKNIVKEALEETQLHVGQTKLINTIIELREANQKLKERLAPLLKFESWIKMPYPCLLCGSTFHNMGECTHNTDDE
jgi:hypothetical protein